MTFSLLLRELIDTARRTPDVPDCGPEVVKTVLLKEAIEKRYNEAELEIENLRAREKIVDNMYRNSRANGERLETELTAKDRELRAIKDECARLINLQSKTAKELQEEHAAYLGLRQECAALRSELTMENHSAVQFAKKRDAFKATVDELENMLGGFCDENTALEEKIKIIEDKDWLAKCYTDISFECIFWLCQCDDLAAEREALKARLAEAVGLIKPRDKSWLINRYVCEYCNGPETQDGNGVVHTSDCRLAVWLKNVEGK